MKYRHIVPLLIYALYLSACASAGPVSTSTSPSIPRVIGWSPLTQGTAEDVGYGLYSYLLFGREPAANEREKYLRVILHLIRCASEVQELVSGGMPRSRINATYIPVTNWEEYVGSLPPDMQAEWILDNYDYARSRIILSVFRKELSRGPYFVSARSAMSQQRSGVGECIVQDMTLTTEDNVGLWVDAFMSQTRTQNYWEPDVARQLGLNIRNSLSVIADLGTPILTSIDTLVDWLVPDE